MNLLEKAQQFFDSLPEHQKPKYFKDRRPDYDFIRIVWIYTKEVKFTAELYEKNKDEPEGWEWFYSDKEKDILDGTDFDRTEELPKEFYDRLNELFPEPK